MDGPKGVTVIERVVVYRDGERDSETKKRYRKREKERRMKYENSFALLLLNRQKCNITDISNIF